MADIMDKYGVFSRIDSNLKLKIKLFHIFRLVISNIYNLLFVTDDDQVYLYRYDLYFSNLLYTPQIISELCVKGVTNFYECNLFVIALTSDFKIFYLEKFDLKKKARSLNTENMGKIVDLKCGFHHIIVLTSDGLIYGWHDYTDTNRNIKADSLPVKYSLPPITSIFCSQERSFAVSNDGRLYEWGIIRYENREILKNIKMPELITNSPSVTSVCASFDIVYILSEEGKCYYKRDYDLNGFVTIKSEEIFFSIQSIHTCITQLGSLLIDHLAIAVSANGLYQLNLTQFTKLVGYANLFEYMAENYEVTHKTIHIELQQTINKLAINTPEEINIGLRYKLIAEIGFGAFGTVFVCEYFDRKLALKRFNLSEMQDKLLDFKYMVREIQTLQAVQGDRVVRYIQTCIERDCKAYMLMDLYSDNLRNILDIKHLYFGREKQDQLDCIEYYISCQLFYEIIECVQFLHEYKPPIIHRDLKPANILFDKNGQNTGKFFRLCDFGYAKYHQNCDMSHTQGIGTQKYIAPEVLRSRKYGTQSDIYSLSVIGEELFGIDSTSEQSPSDMDLTQIWKYLKAMNTSEISKRPNCADILANKINIINDLNSVEPAEIISCMMKMLSTEITVSKSLVLYCKYNLKIN